MADGVLERLVDLVAGEPKEVHARLADLKPGKRALRGRLVAPEPLRSPLKAAPCLGFYYQSSCRVTSRMRGFMRRPVREALSYADGLMLELEDGVVRLEPKRCDELTHEDHVTLAQVGYDDYQARERLVKERATVKVYGRLKRDGEDGWRMRFYLLELDEPKKTKKPKRGKVARRKRKR